MKLEDFPEIKAAIEADGAIRLFDGRHRNGFVDMDDLRICVERRLLAIDRRDGLLFGVASEATSVCCTEKLGQGSNPHWCCLLKGHEGQHLCGICETLWDTPSTCLECGKHPAEVNGRCLACDALVANPTA